MYLCTMGLILVDFRVTYEPWVFTKTWCHVRQLTQLEQSFGLAAVATYPPFWAWSACS